MPEAMVTSGRFGADALRHAHSIVQELRNALRQYPLSGSLNIVRDYGARCAKLHDLMNLIRPAGGHQQPHVTISGFGMCFASRIERIIL
jgi:hypothetical protein